MHLSTLEPHQELEQILSDVPLDSSVRLLADGVISGTTPTMDAPVGDSEVRRSPTEGEVAFEPPAANDNAPEKSEGKWSFNDVSRTPKTADDEDARPQLEAYKSTLRKHLLQQIRETLKDTRDRSLVELVIDARDDNSYLEEVLEDIGARLPAELGIEIEELSTALSIVQSFDLLPV